MRPFTFFAKANAESENSFIAFYNTKPAPRRRNNYQNADSRNKDSALEEEDEYYEQEQWGIINQ